MRHQQGEDQGNKLFPIAMIILPDDTKRRDKKEPLVLGVIWVGELEFHDGKGCDQSELGLSCLRMLWEGLLCEQKLLCHHRNMTYHLSFPWFFPLLCCRVPGIRGIHCICDRPRLPVKLMVTDKCFWMVICILSKLNWPFSFPWLSGQVIRLLIWCLR